MRRFSTNATANFAIVTGHLGRVAALTVISVVLFALAAAAQSAREVKGATPLVASLLAPYGNQDALRVARDLDANVEELLEAAAR